MNTSPIIEKIIIPRNQKRHVLIVTGLSGAGKTSVMRALEDIGFYCVDNLPVPLLKTLLNLAFQAPLELVRVALGIDARDEQFLNTLLGEVEHLRQEKHIDGFKIVFLHASENTLVKRFQETRRKHPLVSKKIDLISAIRNERAMLDSIKKLADITLETDILNAHDLRSWVQKTFCEEVKREVLVNVVSFGFKYGIPPESNLVWDLRFLPNPFFIDSLKDLNGRHPAIQEYLFADNTVNDYWARLTDFLQFALTKFYQEGRFFVTIAIGCTGGKHRSVAFVEKLGTQKWNHCSFLVRHRDLGKE
ncbi:RNase adapter RapZ [Candidatus Dependentiae bacterium]|jgi:UPF0042 nucleotide-binding protein|nr:RNase adapter RapZ [Candidatus Dependentiae bacterium]